MGEGSDRLMDIKNSNDPLFLIGIFRQGTEEERNAAADRFCCLPASKYVPLMLALKEKNPSVSKWVAITVGRTQQADVAPQLVGLLADRHRDVRETAFNVVSSLIDPEQLMELIRTDFEKAKGDARKKRLQPFLAQAVQATQMMHAGLDRLDMIELKKMGRTPVHGVDSHPKAKPQPPKKVCA